MTFSFAFTKDLAKAAQKAIDTHVVCIFEGGKLSAPAAELDKKYKGLIKHYLKSDEKFKGDAGKIVTLGIKDEGAVRVVLLGLGKKSDLTALKFEHFGGALFKALDSVGARKSALYFDGILDDKGLSSAEAAAHTALGVHLKSYNFDKYKNQNPNTTPKTTPKTKTKKPTSTLTFITQGHSAAKKLHDTYSAVSKGVFLARDLVNEPPNTLYPASYVKRIQAELKPLGVEIDVLDEKKMQKMGFGALLAVGQGSIRESQVVIMRWNGAGKPSKSDKKAPIAFVGKGVTFDTGGISLKPGAEMDLMKMDMGGSAAVVGLMKALAARKAKANVIGIVGLVENMPSDRAYRPGDIITSHAGKTIEVLNTDAEGRLVLADILTYIQDTYKPEVIVDLATLTGAIMVALGFEYCGAFANDDKLWAQLESGSKNTGEKFWRMPLDEAYRKEMESEVADLKNLGLGRYGGACSAAGFLEHFIQDGVKWAHIDIAGTAWWKSDKPTTPKGGTGFPVRALDDMIAKHYEKK